MTFGIQRHQWGLPASAVAVTIGSREGRCPTFMAVRAVTWWLVIS